MVAPDDMGLYLGGMAMPGRVSFPSRAVRGLSGCSGILDGAQERHAVERVADLDDLHVQRHVGRERTGEAVMTAADGAHAKLAR